MRLALDNHFSTTIAQKLRDQGLEVIAAIELGWDQLPDDELFELCVADRRAVLTNNTRDFIPIIQDWAVEGRSHSGLLLTADSSTSRSRPATGSLIRRLDELMRLHQSDDALVDRVIWL